MAGGENREDTTIWLSHSQKCIAFHAIPGYERVCYADQKEMWEAVTGYIDSGYMVQ